MRWTSIRSAFCQCSSTCPCRTRGTRQSAQSSSRTPPARPSKSGRVRSQYPILWCRIKKLYALDPSVELWKMAQKWVMKATFPIESLATSAEAIPLGDTAIDTVVTTWTLCTIPDAAKALLEMMRVLKPGGTLIFIEHGWSPDPHVRA